MKRLFITICIVMIAAVGMAGAGCDGGGKIKFGDAVDMTAGAEGEAEIADMGVDTTSSGGVTCDPMIIETEVVKEDKSVEVEGQTCLMSRVPDNVSLVFSIDRSAQQIVSAAVDNMQMTDAEKAATLQKFLMPFDQLDLEEIVGFATFKYVDGVMKKPDDACRLCMDTNVSNCLPAAMTDCGNMQPPPEDFDRCAWDIAISGSLTPACDDWSAKCYEQCSEEKPEPESIGILVRWLSRDDDVDGAQKMIELKDFIEGLNTQMLEGEVEKWEKECLDSNGNLKLDANGNAICDPSPPAELKADKKMEIEQIDSTIALVHSTAVRPNIIEPVRICNYIRFDGIKARPAAYGELLDMKLIMKIKPGEAFTEATRDSRKIAVGIDLRENFYRLYAGVVDKSSLATGAFVSSVINLGDGFGLELWKQMMLGLGNMD